MLFEDRASVFVAIAADKLAVLNSRFLLFENGARTGARPIVALRSAATGTITAVAITFVEGIFGLGLIASR